MKITTDAFTATVRQHPLVAFFVLAYALTWGIGSLRSVAFAFAVLSAFGPALAAVIVTALTDGQAGVKVLLQRLVQWRIGLEWYAIALGLPIVLSFTGATLNVLLGGVPGRPPPFDIFTHLQAFFFYTIVVGEELGWRGYALPQLLARRSALSSSLILGIMWVGWHLPGFIVPGLTQYGFPFPPYFLENVALAVLLTWLYNHTKGSVLLATLFHAAVNFSGIFYWGISPQRQSWLGVAVTVTAALLLIILCGPHLMCISARSRRRQMRQQRRRSRMSM